MATQPIDRWAQLLRWGFSQREHPGVDFATLIQGRVHIGQQATHTLHNAFAHSTGMHTHQGFDAMGVDGTQ